MIRSNVGSSNRRTGKDDHDIGNEDDPTYPTNDGSMGRIKPNSNSYSRSKSVVTVGGLNVRDFVNRWNNQTMECDCEQMHRISSRPSWVRHTRGEMLGWGPLRITLL